MPSAAEGRSRRGFGVLATLAATGVTLLAFAANSVLGRAALSDGSMDPISFTAIRLLAGGVMLAGIVVWMRDGSLAVWNPRGLIEAWRQTSIGAAVSLLVYAFAFSLAYITLPAATGTLVLFGCVQITMIGWGLWRGERPSAAEWLGDAMAIFGVLILMLPGVQTPSVWGAAWMAIAGVAWGVYSLFGKGSSRPVFATAGNFLRAAPVAIVAIIAMWGHWRLGSVGVVLALVSGAITSGLGYVIWYFALQGLTSTQAALVQLAVPIVAGLGGVLLLGESITLRLVIAAVLVLGGIALATLRRRAEPVLPDDDCEAAAASDG